MPPQVYNGHRIDFWLQVWPWPWIFGAPKCSGVQVHMPTSFEIIWLYHFHFWSFMRQRKCYHYRHPDKGKSICPRKMVGGVKMSFNVPRVYIRYIALQLWSILWGTGQIYKLWENILHILHVRQANMLPCRQRYDLHVPNTLI